MMAMFDEAEKILQVMSNIIYKTGEFLELTIDGFVMLDKHKKKSLIQINGGTRLKNTVYPSLF